MPLQRKDVVTLAGRYIDLHNQARELTNAVGREATTLKKHLVKYMEENNLSPGFGFHINEYEIRYGLGKPAGVVPPEVVIKMFKAGEITEKQLAEIIDVRKGDAERVLGADVVAANTETRPGKTVDIRITKVDEVCEEPQDLLPDKPVAKFKQPQPAGEKKRLIRIPQQKAGIQPLPTRTPAKPLQRIKFA